LKTLIQSYIKVAALGAIREISDKELERNVRLLSAAGYSSREIGAILDRSKTNINDLLAGKTKARKAEQ